MNNKIIFLTGASGFIGKAFLRRALAIGWRVRVLTRKPADWMINRDFELHMKLLYLGCTIIPESELEKLLSGF